MIPIPKHIIQKKIEVNGIQDIKNASIRQIAKLVKDIEEETGIQFIKMEMGVPGLAPPQIGVKAEIEALRKGVASIYPSIEGIPALKLEISRFAKQFLKIDISPDGCVPTVGSMQGGFASFITTCQCDEKKNKLLFIDPGFPVQKQQMKILGLDYESFDVYNYRGQKLRDKLEQYCQNGSISSILYSNPNNPSWICLTEEELQIIAEVAQDRKSVV